MPSEKRLARRAVLDESGLERARSMHPWIFRGNIRHIPQCVQGDMIAFTDRAGVIKGWGLWSESALSIRVLTYGTKEPDQMVLLRDRLTSALKWRKIWCPGEEAFRWVHGEADGLPASSQMCMEMYSPFRYRLQVGTDISTKSPMFSGRSEGFLP